MFKVNDLIQVRYSLLALTIEIDLVSRRDARKVRLGVRVARIDLGDTGIAIDQLTDQRREKCLLLMKRTLKLP